MINGMPIFYNSKTGSGLEPIQTKGKGLEPVQTKKGKGTCTRKCNKKQLIGSGLKILNYNFLIIYY